MRKLKLELEELTVETFRVERDGANRTGTVIALQQYTGSCPEVCGDGGGGGGGGSGLYDCDATIHYSCYNSCNIAGSCDTTCP
jgi:hypothetical protein